MVLVLITKRGPLRNSLTSIEQNLVSGERKLDTERADRSNYRVWRVRFSAPVNNAVENTEPPLVLPGMKEMNRGNGKQPPRWLLLLDSNTLPGF